MTRKIQAPFVDFGFYIHGVEESELLARLLRILLDLGATPSGDAFICPRDIYLGTEFRMKYDLPLSRVLIRTSTQLLEALMAQGIQIINVELVDSTTMTKNTAEWVQFEVISEEASKVHAQHPVSIVTSGDIMDAYFMPEFASRRSIEKAIRAAKNGYKRFLSIIQMLQPSYATITIEEGIKCPFDLSRSPSVLLFRDFYVSREFVGTQQVDNILKLYQGAYFETLEHGVYISSIGVFSPTTQRTFTHSFESESKEVCRILGRAGGY